MTDERPKLWREILLGLALFGAYLGVERLARPARVAAADRHGRDLLAVERWLHVPVEEPLNRWLAARPALQPFANYEYALTYLLSAAAMLVWLYRRRPATYRWARDSFVVMNAIALLCFAVYPTAPPRLLAGEGFTDTVLSGGTWASWGSPLVRQANQVAAMPSLHIGWAVWVSIVLACVSGARWLQGLSAFHVLLTAAVVMATANHYLLDVVAGVALVGVTLAVTGLAVDRPGRAPRLAAADAFFLHVESPAWPQHVGGLIVLDDADPATYAARLRDRLESQLPRLPRFRQQLAPAGRWRRARWTDAPTLDWQWHMPTHDLRRPDGAVGDWDALTAYVAALQSAPLPRDRPLWRFVTVTGFAEDRVAAILLVHHCVADGIGTIAQAVRLLDPVPPELTAAYAPLPWWRRTAAVVVGLAQLAVDGTARYRLPSRDGPGRYFATFTAPLAEVRAIAARRGVRITDVLLTVVAGALSRSIARPPPELRVTTPLMVRAPDRAAEGNVTAGVMLTLPLDPRPECDRLSEIGRRARDTPRAGRAAAARFVMSTAAAVLPPPVHAWFARTVYGYRFLQAIVSNMPGAVGRYRMAGGRLAEVYPILPLAPRAPVALGVIGWDGTLYASIGLGPDLVDTGTDVVDAARKVLAELGPDQEPAPRSDTRGDAATDADAARPAPA